MNKTTLYFTVLLTLVLSACTKASAPPDVFTLKTPEGESTVINHKPVKVSRFADGQLTATCNRSTEAEIRGDQPEIFVNWSKQYDVVSIDKSFKILVIGDPNQLNKEVIVRLETVEKLRTTFDTSGFEKSAQAGEYGPLLKDIQITADLMAKIEEVARRWAKISFRYSCSLPE